LEDGIGTAVYERALWTSVHQGKAPSFVGSEPPCPERASKATGRRTVMVCLDSARWLCRHAFIQFLKGHESHDYCDSSSFYHYSWDQHYDFSAILVILILVVFSQCNTSYSLTSTIDETSRPATAGLVTSTRVLSYVG